MWLLAESLEIPPEAVPYAVGDCTAATLGLNGGSPSNCPWVKHVWLAFAEALGRQRPNLYVPAQHPLGGPPL